MRPAEHRPLPFLLAVGAALSACGEQEEEPTASANPPRQAAPVAAKEGDAGPGARLEDAEARFAEALARTQERIRQSRPLLEVTERRSRELIAEVDPPLDPARSRSPEGLVLDGGVVSRDEASGVVVLSLGVKSGVRQGYRLTISRRRQYVGIVEIDGLEEGGARRRSISGLQARVPHPRDRVRHR